MAILDQQDIWEAYEELFYQKVNPPKDFGLTQEAMTDLLTDFMDRVSNDSRLLNLIDKLGKGTATYSDLDEFALYMGKHLGNAMYATLPAYASEGYITQQVADVLIPGGLRTNYEAIIEYATATQKGLNERAKLGLNAVAPDYDYKREKGLVNYATEKPWKDRAKSVRDAVTENGQYYADESARLNAEAQYNVGLSPVIKRIPAWRCCKWCDRLGGTYQYSPDMNREIFQRHSNCNCQVLFYPGDGKVQNVHTKKWSTAEQLAERKASQPPTTTAREVLKRIAETLDN